MSRLKPAEIAIILERVKTDAPADAEALALHIESIGSEDAMMQLVREMVEAKQESKAAEDKTSATLSSWKPIMDSVAASISKLAKEEQRRNDLDEKKFELAEKNAQREYDQSSERVRALVVPLVTAAAGALTSAAAFYFGG